MSPRKSLEWLKQPAEPRNLHRVQSWINTLGLSGVGAWCIGHSLFQWW